MLGGLNIESVLRTARELRSILMEMQLESIFTSRASLLSRNALGVDLIIKCVQIENVVSK